MRAGTRVRHRGTGVEGVVVGRPIAQPSAGGAATVRVEWSGPFRDRVGRPFVRDLEPVSAVPHACEVCGWQDERRVAATPARCGNCDSDALVEVA